MSEIKKENLEGKNESQEIQNELQDLSAEVLDTNLDPKLVEEIEKEAEESLVELEKENTDKKSKWKTVKGEVEIEGKKVEITYREKVIALPKHRQEQTGITRIRRRELLPPLPEGFYIPLSNRVKDAQKKLTYHFAMNQERVEYLAKNNSFPAYSTNNKFGDVYKFLTNSRYPSEETLAHVMNYRLNDPTLVRQEEFKDIDRFKKEGLYFQEIEEGKSGELYFRRGKAIIDYGTPLFIFGIMNKKFLEYIKSLGMDQNILHYDRSLTILLKKRKKPLRWCHAECAIIPTKRGLNVLFFESSP